MLDPFTAISLAGSVVQFVHFGCKIIAESHNVYKAGAETSKHNLETESVTLRLLETVEELEISRKQIASGAKAPSERRLMEIAEACTMVAKDILDRLERLKIKESPTVWKCVAKALKAAWSRDELNALTRRLKAYVSELDTNILISIKYMIS